VAVSLCLFYNRRVLMTVDACQAFRVKSCFIRLKARHLIMTLFLYLSYCSIKIYCCKVQLLLSAVQLSVVLHVISVIHEDENW
jgi:hypothetical protein